jgi:hypothetical protein
MHFAVEFYRRIPPATKVWQPMSRENTYWGILCRKCSAPIAFGSPSHQQFKLESTCARPGAIRCPNGHNHIYFPRDFNFFESAEVIPETAMEKNRRDHSAINPIATVSTNHWHGTRWSPPEPYGAVRPVTDPKAVSPASIYDRDPRREMAQAAAKERWAAWAIKKVS